MKAVRLLEDTMVAGIMRPKGSIVYVEDSFVQGAIPVFLTEDEILRLKVNAFAANFADNLASGAVTVVNMGNNLYCFTRWMVDAEGDQVAADTMTIKKKTLNACKQYSQVEKAVSAAAYNAAIDTITAMINACV